MRNFESSPPFDFEFPGQILGKRWRQEVMGRKVLAKNPRNSELRTEGE